jgi:hypothetical protein
MELKGQIFGPAWRLIFSAREPESFDIAAFDGCGCFAGGIIVVSDYVLIDIYKDRI